MHEKASYRCKLWVIILLMSSSSPPQEKTPGKRAKHLSQEAPFSEICVAAHALEYQVALHAIYLIAHHDLSSPRSHRAKGGSSCLPDTRGAQYLS